MALVRVTLELELKEEDIDSMCDLEHEVMFQLCSLSTEDYENVDEFFETLKLKAELLDL